MDLWSWAVAAYGRPGVAPTALALQDEHGQCVPLLLWGAFARPADPDVIGEAVSLARAWERAAILPLRAARRNLKSPLPGADTGPREALRDQVKAAELAAERLLLAALAPLGPGVRDAGPPLAVLQAIAKAWGPTSPGAPDALSAGLTRLSAALSHPPDPGDPAAAIGDGLSGPLPRAGKTG
ncbi:TIGR02444 family protein [Phenylobacterium sp.]|uniref:TIGR02444 family protein n=1 Tax=Phenylobacterium sp. TaxID=1871053 RepID=UPI002730CA00|nr:TIGR02444 family protein [Phenylobacterium sp.]MDP2213948.1 TIGR02444 family protein [Phenylobacterium sp.]